MKASIVILESALEQHKYALKNNFSVGWNADPETNSRRQEVVGAIFDLEKGIEALKRIENDVDPGDEGRTIHADILDALCGNAHYLLTKADEMTGIDLDVVKFYFKQHRKNERPEMDFELAKERLMNAIFGEDMDSEKEGDVRGSELFTERDMIGFANYVLEHLDPASTHVYVVDSSDLNDWKLKTFK